MLEYINAFSFKEEWALWGFCRLTQVFLLIVFCHFNMVQDGDKEFSQDVLDERAKKAEAWHRDSAARARYTKPSPPITCATFAQDVLEGRANVSQAHDHKHQSLIFGPASLMNGSLMSERERMAAKVFQPGFRYIFMPFENKLNIQSGD